MKTKEQEKFVRKNYFVLKGFQLRFSIIIFIATLVVSLISVWTTHMTAWNEVNLQTKGMQVYDRIHEIYERENDAQRKSEIINSVFTLEFDRIFRKISSMLILNLLVIALILFVLSIFVSHKIAGPIVRMKSVAQAIIRGDLSINIKKLRAGDELTELADAIHGAVLKMRTAVEKMGAMADTINDLAAQVNEHTEKDKTTSFNQKKTAKDLQVAANKLVTEINKLRVPLYQTKDKPAK